MKKIVIGFVLVFSFLFTGVAQAHTVTIYRGSDSASVNFYHTFARIIDRECDSSPVEVEVSYGGFSVRQRDENGCEPGSNTLAINDSARSFRLCEYDRRSGWECTSWHRL